MPPRAHSILGESAADRWMHCPPSAQLTAEMEDKETTFDVESTAAHALAEWKVRKALKQRVGRRPTSDFWTDEMEECTDDYRDYVMDLIGQAKQHCSDPIAMVEQHLDFRRKKMGIAKNKKKDIGLEFLQRIHFCRRQGNNAVYWWQS